MGLSARMVNAMVASSSPVEGLETLHQLINIASPPYSVEALTMNPRSQVWTSFDISSFTVQYDSEFE